MGRRYARSVDQGRLHRLTNHAAIDLHPAWSRDGRLIAFLRTWREPGGFRPIRFPLLRPPENWAADEGFYVVPAEGGVERLVAKSVPGTQPLSGRAADWLDDQRLVVSHREAEGTPFRLCSVSLEGGAPRPLTNPPAGYLGDEAPAVSPDGSRIAFLRTRSAGVTDIHLVAGDGGGLRRLTFAGRIICGLTWSPDGRDIVFSMAEEGSHMLWCVRVESGVTRPAIPTALDAYYPAAALRARRLAFARAVSQRDIWRAGLRGTRESSPEKIISSTRNQASPNWSADGRRILFSSDRTGHGHGAGHHPRSIRCGCARRHGYSEKPGHQHHRADFQHQRGGVPVPRRDSGAPTASRSRPPGCRRSKAR